MLNTSIIKVVDVLPPEFDVGDDNFGSNNLPFAGMLTKVTLQERYLLIDYCSGLSNKKNFTVCSTLFFTGINAIPVAALILWLA